MSILGNCSTPPLVIEQVELPIFGNARKFEIVEIKANPDKSWFWTLKVKFEECFEEFYPNYNVHFILQPFTYNSKIENLRKKIEQWQLSLEHNLDDLEREILNTESKYIIDSRDFWMYTFKSIRLKEYKETDWSDSITFIVWNDFIEFFLKQSKLFSESKFAIVINSSADERYPPEKHEDL